jgi:hypothetical protein
VCKADNRGIDSTLTLLESTETIQASKVVFSQLHSHGERCALQNSSMVEVVDFAPRIVPIGCSVQRRLAHRSLTNTLGERGDISGS